MRSSRYIRCGSAGRFRRIQARLPLLSRSTTTYCPTTSDRNPSPPDSYLRQPISQPHAVENSARTPSHYNPTQDYLYEQSDPKFLEELHRRIWGPRELALAQDPASEFEQDLDSPNNKTWEETTVLPELRPSHDLDGSCDAGCDAAWTRGWAEMQTGKLIHYSVSAHTAALFDCETADEALRIWVGQDAQTIEYGWIHPLLTLLSQDVRQACLFLHALCPLSDPPIAAMSDSIRRIRTVLEERREPRGSPATDLLCDTVIHILREHPRRDQLLTQRDIYSLLKLVSPNRLADLYYEVSHAGVFMHHWTLMTIASTLAEEPTLKRAALDVMVAGLALAKNRPDSKLMNDVRHARWAGIFTTILHTKYTPGPRLLLAPKNRDAIGPEEIWEIGLEHGLDPNPIQIGALVDSLFAVGRADAAWDAFDMYIGEKGMPVSMKLATVLLHGSRMTGRLPFIQRALGVVAETGEIDEILGTEILHLVISLAMADSTKIFSSFRLMQRLYSRMFRAEALDELIPEKLRGVVDPDSSLEDMLLFPGFADPLDKLFATQKGMLMDPPVSVLEAMVMSWVCSLKQGFKGPALIAFYGHYRGMLKLGHPIAVQIVQERNSIIHDMIIKGMGTSASHLRSALEVIGDMLHDNEEPAQPSGGARAGMRRPVQQRPTKWTWNILLNSWLQHYRQESVGRIVDLMKKHGVEPTLVTWNTILAKAAQKNNTQLALGASREIRDGGFNPDEWTVSAFARLPDREMFLHEMQRSSTGGTGPAGNGARRSKWG